MFVISPWSKGGKVNSQVFDHTSVIRFLEARFGLQETNITPWRRGVRRPTSAFDFSSADQAVPAIQPASNMNPRPGRPDPLPDHHRGAGAATGRSTACRLPRVLRARQGQPRRPRARADDDQHRHRGRAPAGMGRRHEHDPRLTRSRPARARYPVGFARAEQRRRLRLLGLRPERLPADVPRQHRYVRQHGIDRRNQPVLRRGERQRADHARQFGGDQRDDVPAHRQRLRDEHAAVVRRRRRDAGRHVVRRRRLV